MSLNKEFEYSLFGFTDLVNDNHSQNYYSKIVEVNWKNRKKNCKVCNVVEGLGELCKIIK